MNKEKIMRKTERYLKRTEAYQTNVGLDENYEVDYILFKENPEKVIAYASNIDNMMRFYPFDDNRPDNNYYSQFNFDDDLFAELEKGYQIAGMSLNGHLCVWNAIEENREYNDFTYEKGTQKYLEYCKKNNITKDNISYDGMNVMTLYEKSEKSKGDKENCSTQKWYEKEFEKPLEDIKEDVFCRGDSFENEVWYNDFTMFTAIGVCTPKKEHVQTVQKALKIMRYKTRVAEKNGETSILPDTSRNKKKDTHER